MPISITELPIGGNLKDFLGVVDYIYQSDTQYIRPLDFELKTRLSKKNPFFQHAHGTLFTAHQNGWCIGRASVQVDREHLERHGDGAAFFGFFDTVDDQSVASALLDAASQWAKAQGLSRLRGPLSLSLHEEVGCLVDGFESPPMVMMPHHRPYQGALIEGAGFGKLKDMFAWRYDVGQVPRRVISASEAIEAMPEVKARNIDVKNLLAEVRTTMEIFNDAWHDNWGFVPLTEAELKQLADDFKLLLIPDLTTVVEIDGEPAGFSVCIPNLNEFIHDFKGRLSPSSIAKLLWRFKVRGPQTARMAFLGVRRKFRNQRKYSGLSAFMYHRAHKAGEKLGLRWSELSYTLEDSGPVNAGIRRMGGKLYKTYRVYEREL